MKKDYFIFKDFKKLVPLTILTAAILLFLIQVSVNGDKSISCKTNSNAVSSSSLIKTSPNKKAITNSNAVAKSLSNIGLNIGVNAISQATNSDFVIDGDGVLTKYNGSGGNVVIPNEVTSIGCDAFSGCSGITSIIIPESVKSIDSFAFENCNGLTNVTIPKSITSMGTDVFQGCSNLTKATIEEGSTAIVDNTFSGCSSLQSVSIPTSVTSIGCDAFSGCSGL